jgi:hypothetical protein
MPMQAQGDETGSSNPFAKSAIEGVGGRHQLRPHYHPSRPEAGL